MRRPSGSLASPAVEREWAHGEQAGTPAGPRPETPYSWEPAASGSQGDLTPGGACWLPSTLRAQTTPSSSGARSMPTAVPKRGLVSRVASGGH